MPLIDDTRSNSSLLHSAAGIDWEKDTEIMYELVPSKRMRREDTTETWTRVNQCPRVDTSYGFHDDTSDMLKSSSSYILDEEVHTVQVTKAPRINSSSWSRVNPYQVIETSYSFASEDEGKTLDRLSQTSEEVKKHDPWTTINAKYNILDVACEFIQTVKVNRKESNTRWSRSGSTNADTDAKCTPDSESWQPRIPVSNTVSQRKKRESRRILISPNKPKSLSPVKKKSIKRSPKNRTNQVAQSKSILDFFTKII